MYAWTSKSQALLPGGLARPCPELARTDSGLPFVDPSCVDRPQFGSARPAALCVIANSSGRPSAEACQQFNSSIDFCLAARVQVHQNVSDGLSRIAPISTMRLNNL
jgi:hypothetical protein